jgi:hypothetical protein
MDAEELLDIIRSKGQWAQALHDANPWWRLRARRTARVLADRCALGAAIIVTAQEQGWSADQPPSVTEDPPVTLELRGHLYTIAPTDRQHRHLGDWALTESWAGGSHRQTSYHPKLESAVQARKKAMKLADRRFQEWSVSR